MLHKETVSAEFLNLLERLFSFPELNNFVLVGGTALSLRIANRKSIDIDLFSNAEFSEDGLNQFLREKNFEFQLQSRHKGSLLGYINNIKVDFLRHGYHWLSTPETIEGIRMASLQDIAAMKLNAISGNGTRLKDFVDIAYLSSFFPLSAMLDFCEKKYPDINGVMALKSLSYFDDIDFSVDINYMDPKITWSKVKQRLLKMVQQPGKQFSLLKG